MLRAVLNELVIYNCGNYTNSALFCEQFHRGCSFESDPHKLQGFIPIQPFYIILISNFLRIFELPRKLNAKPACELTYFNMGILILPKWKPQNDGLQNSRNCITCVDKYTYICTYECVLWREGARKCTCVRCGREFAAPARRYTRDVPQFPVPAGLARFYTLDPTARLPLSKETSGMCDVIATSHKYTHSYRTQRIKCPIFFSHTIEREYRYRYFRDFCFEETGKVSLLRYCSGEVAWPLAKLFFLPRVPLAGHRTLGGSRT